MLTIDALRDIPDDDVEVTIFDMWPLDGCPGADALWLTVIVDGDIHNGGFRQLFSNQGTLVEEAVAAFEFFGLDELASILRKAIAIAKLVSENLDQFPFRRTDADPLEPSFREIERLYGKHCDALSLARIARIRAQPELFAIS